MENLKTTSNETTLESKNKPFKYGRIYYYLFILIMLIAHYFVWIKPTFKYFKLL
jgi:hypothetical protein